MATTRDDVPPALGASDRDAWLRERETRRDPSYLAVVDVSATLPEAIRDAGDVHVEVVGDVDPVTGEAAQRVLLQCLSRARRTLVLDVSRASLDGCSQTVLAAVRRAAAERGVRVDVRARPGADGGGVPSVGAVEEPRP